MEQITVRSPDNLRHTPVKVSEEYDEPFLYFALSNISFSTQNFLLGLINFYSYNSLFLTIFEYWFPGVGQAIGGIMSYKIKYYMDGNIYFFFALNCFCKFCFNFFPIWGWMKPLSHIEYGLYFLMCTMFLIAFLIQSLFDKSHLSKAISLFNLLGYSFNTIGNFADNEIFKKMSGIFNFLIWATAYYNGMALIINQKRNRITLPLFDGKHIGQKLY